MKELLENIGKLIEKYEGSNEEVIGLQVIFSSKENSPTFYWDGEKFIQEIK